jgi:hypothetical protein
VSRTAWEVRGNGGIARSELLRTLVGEDCRTRLAFAYQRVAAVEERGRGFLRRSSRLGGERAAEHQPAGERRNEQHGSDFDFRDSLLAARDGDAMAQRREVHSFFRRQILGLRLLLRG